jgi:hypothetical protein
MQQSFAIKKAMTELMNILAYPLKTSVYIFDKMHGRNDIFARSRCSKTMLDKM